MATEIETSGLSLKVLRVQNRVKQQDLASAMGVSASRVAAIEREGFVSPQAAERYLRALDTCTTRRTSGGPA